MLCFTVIHHYKKNPSLLTLNKIRYKDRKKVTLIQVSDSIQNFQIWDFLLYFVWLQFWRPRPIPECGFSRQEPWTNVNYEIMVPMERDILIMTQLITRGPMGPILSIWISICFDLYFYEINVRRVRDNSSLVGFFSNTCSNYFLVVNCR